MMTYSTRNPDHYSQPQKAGVLPYLMRFVGVIDSTVFVLLFLAVLAVLSLAVVEENAGIAVLFIILSLPALVSIAKQHGKPRAAEISVFTTILTTATLAACLFFAYYKSVNGTAYPYGLSDDDYAFDSKAMDIYEADLLDFPSLRDHIAALSSGTWNVAFNYSILIAFLYRGMEILGFEPHPLYPRFVNALVLALIASLVHRMAKFCDLMPWQCRLAAYLCGLTPLMVYFSAHTYRDLLSSLAVTAVIAAVIQVVKPQTSTQMHRRTGKLVAISLLVFGLTLGDLMRDTYLATLAGTALVCVILARLPKLQAMLTIGSLAFLACTALLLTGIDVVITPNDLEKLDYYHTRHADAAGNITGAVFRLPYLISLPARFILRNVTPLPLPQQLATDTFMRLGTILWFFGLPFLFRSAQQAFRHQGWNRNRSLRIVVCGFLAFYCLNIATTLQDRHVVNYIPPASLAVVHGLVSNPFKVWQPVLTMLLIAIVLALLMLLRVALPNILG